MTRRPLSPLTTSLVLLAADTLSLLVACWTAVLVRRALGGAFPLALYAEVTPFVLLFPGLFALQGLYPGTLIAPADALKRLCQSISLGFALLVVLSFLAKHGPLYSRGVMAMAWGAGLAAVPLARVLVRRFCLRQGRWGQAAVLVGADASTAQLEATLLAHPELGITPVARMDPSGARTQGALPPPRQGVAILLVEPGQVEALLDGPLAGFGRVLLAPQLPALPSLWTDTADVAGTLLVDVRMKLLDPHRQRLKRLLDLAITLTALPLAVPVLLVPLCGVILGLSWFLAALGVYVRDLGPLVQLGTTVLMFLSPIFYPASALPERFRGLLALNPLLPSIEMVRDALLRGALPDPAVMLAWCAAGLLTAWAGFAWFQKTRTGFADVL